MRTTPLLSATLAIVTAFSLAAPAGALTTDESRHFLARTGFGGTPAEIAALEPLSREQAVDWAIKGTYESAPLAPPEWCANPLAEYLAKRKEEWKAADAIKDPDERIKAQNALRNVDYAHGRELKRWWYQVMIGTPSPLTERMVLFWHNHFTSNLETVEDPRLMYEQNVTLRKYAVENFGHFAKAMPYDPAMFRFLDSNSNVRGHPNENFAREVMELFTVGEGHYTEADIKEAARAFTGYKVTEDGHVAIDPRRHDDGKKTVMGNSGMFDADKILETLLVKEQDVALYIAGKFYREFIDEIPEEGADKKAVDKEIYEIAAAFYKSRYSIRAALKRTLMSDRFWDPAVRGDLVKSPVEMLVGTVHTLGLDVKNADALREMGKKLGEDLFDPPNVKGWNGGLAWISTQSLVSRWEVMDQIANGDLAQDKGEQTYAPAEAGMMGADASAAEQARKKSQEAAPLTAMPGKKKEEAEKGPVVQVDPDAKKWVEQAKAKGAEGVQLAARVLLPIAPSEKLDGQNVDQAIHALLRDPAYNLK